MATSGSVNFALTANEAVNTALEMVKTVGIGGTAGAVDAATARKHANLQLKTWGIDERLWITTEGTIPLVAATASYSLPLARRVTSVRRRTSSIDTPLMPMSRQAYYDYPAKSSAGMPYQYYFDPQRATRTLFVVNVPDASIAASTTLQYTYQRVIEDLDSLNDDIDTPQEWLEAFVYSLAARLLIPYGRYISDPNSAARIEARAGELYAQLTASSEEDGSVFFQPA